MSENSTSDITTLLSAIAEGDTQAADRLFPIVYDELHRRASSYMRGERDDHTLQPTALIHEAYLRLMGGDSASPEFRNIEHFLATAALVMRRILVNHAKAKQAEKRGGNQSRTSLELITPLFSEKAIDLVALDEALVKLQKLDETQHRLVELRFFGGLTVGQCSKLLGISERQLYYEWSHAKAWLRAQVEGADDAS